MLVFRSLVLGLVGACFLLLLVRPPYEVRVVHDLRASGALAPAAATIIDVSPQVEHGQIASLVRLEPGEHVTAVDDAPVTNDLDAGTAIAGLAVHAHRYLDLAVAGPSGPRRVLVLLH